MEIQLVINGSLDEIKEIFALLNSDDQKAMVAAAIRAVTHVSHPVDWSEPLTEEREETPLEFAPPLADQEEQQNPRGKRDSVPNALGSLCHQCGKLFHPKRQKTKFCSKRCYMIEWHEVHKPAKNETKSDCATTQYARRLPDDQASALKEKLEKIKKTCPAPTSRPNISRELNA